MNRHSFIHGKKLCNYFREIISSKIGKLSSLRSFISSICRVANLKAVETFSITGRKRICEAKLSFINALLISLSAPFKYLETCFIFIKFQTQQTFSKACQNSFQQRKTLLSCQLDENFYRICMQKIIKINKFRNI